MGLSTICIINKTKIVLVENEYIKCILNGYLNDILGTIVFMLYLSIVLSFFKKKFNINLFHVELTALISGLLWEYVTPLYSSDTVCDPFDLLAYMGGGLVFWYICDGDSLMNNKTNKKRNI